LKVFDDLELVGEADSGEAAVQLCGQVLPDVILMDLMMPDMDGASATRLIRQQYPKVQVVVLTSFQEEGLVRNALQAGAIGYLLKDVSAEIWPGDSRGALGTCYPISRGYPGAGPCC